MKFNSNGNARANGFIFKIAYDNYLDEIRQESCYYLCVEDTKSKPRTYARLERTQRFKTPEDAIPLCKAIAEGMVHLDKLIQAERAADALQYTKIKAEAEKQIDKFVAQAKALGVSPASFAELYVKFNDMNGCAQNFFLDQDHQAQFRAERNKQAKAPNPNHEMTLGDYMSKIKQDVDIVFMDNQNGLHSSPCVCYLSKDDLRRGTHQDDWEKWAMSLPVIDLNDPTCPGHAILATGLSEDETTFVLDQSQYYESEFWRCQASRADYAGADFNQRLAFVKDRTPFEIPFDPDCMDVEAFIHRDALCKLLSECKNVYIASYPSSPEDFYAYALDIADDGIHFQYKDNCEIPVIRTEPGKGLSATLEGKLLAANQEKPERNEASAKQAEKEAELV